MRHASVRVPASAANVGPGYDAFGLALALHNTFSATPADEWVVDVEGEGAGTLGTGAGNQVAAAMARVFAETDGAPRAAHVVCENRIPTGRGLGSSAAAIVGGLVLGDALCGGRMGQERLLELAVEIEGHPDNVAAALLGGFTIGWRRAGGPSAVTLPLARGLAAVAVIAHEALPTSESRGLLPEMVPHADAAFNSARAGLLSAGLILGRDDLVTEGLADCLHERYRASAIPDLDEVAAALLDAGALGAVLSGAGPTVIGLVAGDTDEQAFAIAGDVARAAHDRTVQWPARREPLALRIDREGAVVLGR